MNVPVIVLPRHTRQSVWQLTILLVMAAALLVASALTFADPMLSLTMSLSAIVILVMETVRFASEPLRIQKRYAELMAPR